MMQGKIDQWDLLRARAYEAELKAIDEEAQAKASEFQAFVDSLWLKYNLTKGEDRLEPDGTIVRAAKEERSE